ncbi:MAG: hypothetical protein EBY74_03420, partial [Actinobacteria bacterium]|nr:hypothetical protein [Actinomycetota bacterium]
TITIRATDSLSVTGSLSVTVLVNESVTISGDTSLATTQGITRFTSAYTTNSGTVPRSISVISQNGGAAPAGFTIDSNRLRVDASVTADTYYVYVMATDNAGDTAVVAVTVRVNETLTIGTASNIITTFTRADSVVAFSATRGTAPYQYSIYSVSPSANTESISIDASTGRVTVSGLTNPETYTITIVVTDSVGATDTRTMRIQVNPSVSVAGGSNETTTYGVRRSTSAFTSTGGTVLGTSGAGYANYLYSFTSSPTHAGITISETNGVIRVSETVAAGTYTITVRSTDALGLYGTKVITFLVNDSITVSGGQATLQTTYGRARSSAAFTYSGGTVPLSFTISGLIPGVTISETGVVRVAETTPVGTYTETVTATDFVSATGYKTLIIIVNESVTISGGSNIVTTQGRATFSDPFVTDSGTVPRSLSFSSSATGLRLDTNTGRVHVESTAAAGTYNETVTVTDEAGATARKAITILINPVVALSGATALTTTYSISRSSSVLTASGGTTSASGGQPTDTYTFFIARVTDSASATRDSVTIGLSIDSRTGVVTVSSTTPSDTYTVTVWASDGFGETGSATFTIRVNASISVNGGQETLTTTFGTARTSTAFTYNGGTVPLTFTVSGLNTGVTINQSGQVRVAETTPVGTYLETITATDFVSASGYRTMIIVVNPMVTISGGSNIVTTFGRADSSQPFLTDSGTVPRSLSFSASALGLTLDTNTGRVHVGTNTPAGTYNETVTVTDEAGAIARKAITIRVNPVVSVSGGSAITTTYTIADSSSAFTASGGTVESTGGQAGTTYTFSLGRVTDSVSGIVNAATAGISINSSTGRVSVTSSTPADTYQVSVVAADGLGETGTVSMQIVVNPMITVVGGSSINGYTDSASTHTFTFTNGTGIKTATAQTTGIAGTSWLLTNNQATFSIPQNTTPQTFKETLTITDAKGAQITHVITVVVNKAYRSISISASASTVKYGETLLISSTWVPTASNNGDALTISTTTGAICSVAMRDTNTAILTASGGVGTCTLTAQVLEGDTYVAASATPINVTVTVADTITVTANASATANYTGSALASAPSFTTTGLKNGDVASSVTYTYSSTSGTCAQGGTCSVGDTGPGGGKVFYVAPSAQWWGQYLEAAPSDLTEASWCATGSGSNSAQRGTSSSVGDGKLNSVITATACTAGAMGSARSYAGGGLSDWYLPTSEELALMYSQRTALGLNSSATYWGSDPVDSSTARGYNIATGATATGSKELFQSVRPIRAFSATSNSYGPSTSNPTNAGAYSITPSVLVLGASRSTANYAAVQYVAGSLVINKITQSALSIASQNGARTGVDETYTLYPTGGSSSASNAYRVITGGTAGGCTATTFLSATVAGTCLVTVQRAGDNNYHAVIGSTIEVGFLKFESTTSGRVLQVVDTATKPVINSLSVSTGLAGDTVTLSGGALTGTSLMAIGNVRVTSFTVVNSMTIIFTVPSGSLNGKVGLRNTKGEIAYSAGNFTTLSAPTLTITDSTLTGRGGNAFSDALVFNTTGQVDSYTINQSAPVGLTFSTSTGQFSGTPSARQETITIQLRAHNRAGTASANFTLFISDQVTGLSLMSMMVQETVSTETNTKTSTIASTAETQTASSASTETATQESSVVVATASAPTTTESQTVETTTTQSESVTTNSSSTPQADTSSTQSESVVVTSSSAPSTETTSVSTTSSSETSTPPAPSPSSSSGAETTTTSSSTPMTTSSTPSETPPPSSAPSSESTAPESNATTSSSTESSSG